MSVMAAFRQSSLVRFVDDGDAACAGEERALVPVLPPDAVIDPIARTQHLEDLAFTGRTLYPLGLHHHPISDFAYVHHSTSFKNGDPYNKLAVPARIRSEANGRLKAGPQGPIRRRPSVLSSPDSTEHGKAVAAWLWSQADPGCNAGVRTCRRAKVDLVRAEGLLPPHNQQGSPGRARQPLPQSGQDHPITRLPSDALDLSLEHLNLPAQRQHLDPQLGLVAVARCDRVEYDADE